MAGLLDPQISPASPLHLPCISPAGAPYYMAGLLDQGYWPDGLYTAPSDEALCKPYP